MCVMLLRSSSSFFLNNSMNNNIIIISNVLAGLTTACHKFIIALVFCHFHLGGVSSIAVFLIDFINVIWHICCNQLSVLTHDLSISLQIKNWEKRLVLLSLLKWISWEHDFIFDEFFCCLRMWRMWFLSLKSHLNVRLFCCGYWNRYRPYRCSQQFFSLI